FRVWLVLDGDVLYVDRNGNGDLTEADKRVIHCRPWFQAGDLVEPDGETKHTYLRVAGKNGKEMVVSITVHGQHREFAGHDGGYRGPLNLRFADQAQDAPIIHFGGRRTLRLYKPTLTFVPGQTVELEAIFGTAGLGEGTFVKPDIPLEDSASAEISFPTKN